MLATINRAFLRTESWEIDYQPFPSRLTDLYLSCNFSGYSSNWKEVGDSTEDVLARVLDKVPSCSVERIHTSRLPIDHHGNVITGELLGGGWLEARKTLERVCVSSGYELVIVEEEF